MFLEIFRYDPGNDSEGRFETFEVPFHEEWVVLDAINYIKDELDGSLSYRWSCRMGVCGSCGMVVDGVPKLTCSTFLKDYYPYTMRVEPLNGFPVRRDLVPVVDKFIEHLHEVSPWIIRKDGQSKPLAEGEYLQTPSELAQFKQYSMCINCMLCYSACPVFVQNDEFVGPAAIALGQRYNMDSRDQGRPQRQEVIASSEGVWECTFVGQCSAVCPKHVDPAAAIQRAKVSSTVDWYGRLLMPWSKDK